MFMKLKDDGLYIRFIFQEVDPHISTKIIYKGDIVFGAIY
jgi:hypothetical protein